MNKSQLIIHFTDLANTAWKNAEDAANRGDRESERQWATVAKCWDGAATSARLLKDAKCDCQQPVLF